ncbi:MAG: HAD family hydrolase, partial [Oscillospiraceae bacterium]|nr:HAD family hydrolase [Oscillospiraceae bacterium]
KRERIAAIGDYYNDLEMLEYAGVGATVEEALDEIKGACDFVAGKCEDGAVADFIEYLESMCE